MDEAFGQELVTLVTEDGTFDLVLASEQEMRAFVAGHPDDAIETWRVAVILDDPAGVLGRLREDVLDRERQGKDRLSEADLRTREFNIVDKLRAAEHALEADPPTAGLLVSLIISDLTALAFDRRGEWTPGPKQRLPELRKLDPEFGTVADRVLTGATLRARVAAARSLAELVLRH